MKQRYTLVENSNWWIKKVIWPAVDTFFFNFIFFKSVLVKCSACRHFTSKMVGNFVLNPCLILILRVCLEAKRQSSNNPNFSFFLSLSISLGLQTACPHHLLRIQILLQKFNTNLIKMSKLSLCNALAFFVPKSRI